MIYTSYYGGEQIGTSICISITQKHGYSFQDLRLFKPSDTLFKFWKNSKKDAEAEKHYTDVFLANLSTEEADKEIDVWLHLITRRGNDVTLNCHEPKGFCHRHLVGEIIKSKRPELWGSEVSELNKEQGVANELPLFSTAQTSIEPQFKKGDKIQYKHPKADGWMEAVFENFYTPPLAPKDSAWSFIELSVKGRSLKAFSLNQIRPFA